MSRDRRGDGIQEVVGSIPISSTNPPSIRLNGGRKAAVFIAVAGSPAGSTKQEQKTPRSFGCRRSLPIRG